MNLLSVLEASGETSSTLDRNSGNNSEKIHSKSIFLRPKRAPNKTVIYRIVNYYIRDSSHLQTIVVIPELQLAVRLDDQRLHVIPLQLTGREGRPLGKTTSISILNFQ